MKNKVITMSVVAVVLAGIMVLNRLEPRRLAEAQYDAERRANTSIEAAEDAELEKAAEIQKEAMDKMVEEGFKRGREVLAQKSAEEAKSKTELDALLAENKDYRVIFDCSNGKIVLEVSVELAPLGAIQFRKAIEDGVYNDARFFRVIPGFMAQFGIAGEPAMAAKWEKAMIKDDPVKASNTRGTLSFATAGPNTRTTQVFINFGDNSNLDSMGFAPFARVVEGMDVVDSIFSGYGARSNDQEGLKKKGNEYLDSKFPKLDYIKKATIEEIPTSEVSEDEESEDV